MDTKLFQQILAKLQQQRANLTDWLTNTPPEKKKVCLGPENETAAKAHLDLLDETIAKAQSKSLGLCEVCNDYVEPEHLLMDFTACVCLSHYSEEQKRQLECELEVSHELQRALLPQTLPQIPGLELAAYTRPAEIIGGDFFDFGGFKDGAASLTIADVMGKGLPAGMLVAGLQSSLRLLVPENDSSAAVVHRLNLLFCHSLNLIRFITLFSARYDAEAHTLTYCNAGHHPPLLVSQSPKKSATVQWLQPTGAAIGLVESFRFGERTVILRPDDVLILYTDGVTEAMNEGMEEFGEARLEKLARQHAKLQPAELLERIKHNVVDHAGNRGLADDFTLVIAKAVA